MLSDDFYRAFEDRHRGSRDLIQSRLNAYLPFVQPLREVDPTAQAIDLGCGRGEWLELLGIIGFNAVGIDLDAYMLEACRELGLKVEQGDAITFISALPHESQSLVSAFHVVEHIAFQDLQTLVAQALRVLRPGGLLILETPNPENILVATRDFYLDPTHQHPIPPSLLAFLPEHYGFERTKILRLQERKELSNSACLTLQNVLEGVSPDYAVIAQKAGPEAIALILDEPFSRDYGCSLENLAHRYHEQFLARFGQAEARSLRTEVSAEQAEAISLRAEARAEQAEASAKQAEIAANELAIKLRAVYSSTSWRVTEPLRVAKQTLGRFVLKIKKALYPVVAATIGHVLARPRLRAKASHMLRNLPWLHQRLLRVAIRTSLVSAGYHQKSSAHLHEFNDSFLDHGDLKLGMTPEARRIYKALQKRINGRQAGGV